MCAVKCLDVCFSFLCLSQAPKLIWLLLFFLVFTLMYAIVKWHGPLFRYSTLSVSGVHAIICITLIYILLLSVHFSSFFLSILPIPKWRLPIFMLWWREIRFDFLFSYLRQTLALEHRIAWIAWTARYENRTNKSFGNIYNRIAFKSRCANRERGGVRESGKRWFMLMNEKEIANGQTGCNSNRLYTFNVL